METEETAPPIPTLPLVLAVLILAAYALASVLTGFLHSGMVAAVLVVPLTLHLPWLAQRAPRAAKWALKLASLLITAVAFATFIGYLPPLMYWSFIVPLVLFAVWPLWFAIAGTAVFIASILTLATDPSMGMVRHQFVPMLLLATALTLVFVYLREYKAAQLAPLWRTDSLTLASTRNCLETDLHREIQRGEREGTPVTVVALQLDEPESTLPGADRNNLIVRLGQLLHRTLRNFDSYYRIEETTFFLVLPVTDTYDAATTAELLRRQTYRMLSGEGLELSVSAGVAGMNVADDTRALEQKALGALRRAHKQGGNRVLTHADAGGSSD